MRKVYLDDLPKWETKKNNGRIRWDQSVGHIVKFEYDNIQDEFAIVGYNEKNRKLTVKYEGEIKEPIYIGDFITAGISRLIGITTVRYKYKVGEMFNFKNGTIRITKQIRINKGEKYSDKGYNYECLSCGYCDGEITEFALTKQIGCSVCSGHKVLKGYNDLWTTHFHVASKLFNPEDGYKYTYGSNKKVDFKCLDCGEVIKNKIIYNVVRQGFSCPRCSDGISYPEKFVYNFFQQLNINFKIQQKFNWSDNKRYDFYIANKNTIVETHGEQHYSKGFYSIHSQKVKSLEEEKENDSSKEELAKENGIDKYIILDCRKSELDWIKNSILNSELARLYDLSKIDWLKCHEYACNSLVKKVCDLWNELKDTKLISKTLTLDKGTVNKYLKQGSSLDWCVYTKESQEKLRNENLRKAISRKIICINTKEVFDSIIEASKKYNIKDSSISHCCKGYRKSIGKHSETKEYLIWMYLEDYTPEKIQKRISLLKNSRNLKQEVIQLSLDGTFIARYSSVIEASQTTNIDKKFIYRCCSGKRNFTKNFRWMILINYYQFIKSKPIKTKLEKEFIHNYELENGMINQDSIHITTEPIQLQEYTYPYEQLAIPELNIQNEMVVM